MRWVPYLVNGTGPVGVPVRRAVAQVYAWACERIYHELAGAYDVAAWLTSAGQWRRWQRMAWREVRGPRVLELGSGPGHLLAEGAELGLAMTGLELSAEMVRLARRDGSGGVCVRGDGRALPFGDESFDTVMATFPAGYALEAATLGECRRVLTPGVGRLVIVGLWVQVDLGGCERLLPFFYGRPRQDRLAELADRVAQAGFSVTLRAWRDGRATVGGLVAEAR